MTDLIAYRYKTRLRREWCKWRAGRLRDNMMIELREIGTAQLTIVQCVVPRRNGTDPTNGAANELWEWTASKPYWHRVNRRNWFADSCDPTYNYDDDDPDEPFGKAIPLTDEQRAEIHRQVYGIDHVSHGMLAFEMAEEADAQ